jgi:hypothetical protein
MNHFENRARVTRRQRADSLNEQPADRNRPSGAGSCSGNAPKKQKLANRNEQGSTFSGYSSGSGGYNVSKDSHYMATTTTWAGITSPGPATADTTEWIATMNSRS